MTAAYIVWAPPFTHRSGGVRALYKLCAKLRSAGYPAAIQMMDNGREYDGPWIDSPYDAPSIDTAAWPAHQAEIVIYPETIVDNPAGAPMFVRWMLGPVERDGVCFQWLPSIGDKPVLHVPIIETDLFFPRHGVRDGVAYWVGKATAEHRARWLPEGAYEIPRDVPATRDELAELFGGLERLISLDGYSSVNLEAAMCGTPVRVYTESRWPRLQARDAPFVSSAGIVYDDEPWERAVATVQNAYVNYVASIARMGPTVVEFIAITQTYAEKGWPG